VSMGAILGSIVLLLAGSVWTTQSYCAQQPTDADTKKQGAANPPDASAEKSTTGKEGKVKDGSNLPQPYPTPYRHSFAGLAKDFLQDQEQIWTSPARVRFSDATWLIPAGGFAAGLFVTDSEFSKHLSNSPSTISRYKNLSNAGVGALIGGAGGMWLLGHVKHNEHWSETGFLAGAAALNSLVAVEALKYSLGRERPYQGNGSGAFFQGGTSFPSEHAAAAWAVAGVVAHEYSGTLPKIMAYGLATLVDLSRVKARQHFPSDVFIGSAIGNLVGQNIFSRHHDPALGGEAWRSISEIFRREGSDTPSSKGTPYVPLDSWVYSALDRLIGMGYIETGFLGTRPWTRFECARLINEAGEKIEANDSVSPPIKRLFDQLSKEFQSDLESLSGGSEGSLRLESLYTISTEIAGPPLSDSYHFGQTIVNNFGRPYERGFNSVEGFSGWGIAGRFTIYVRGEYQHAPSAPGLSQSVQNLIAGLDATPVQQAAPIAATSQFRLLDSYVAAKVDDWDLSFGKQSLWWGPGEGGPLLFSDNTEPIYMFRASRVAPFTLPWIFRRIGPMKLDAFIGKLSGNDFPPRPVLHGEKISFKPTRNLEFGFSRLAEMGGAMLPGIPQVPATTKGCLFGTPRALTAAAFFNSYLSFQESDNYGCNDSPGKRTAGFEFSYRLPFLRDWLTLYSDSLSPDDVSPISAPRRAAISPGLYLARFPKLPKLEFRVEGVNTNTPSSSVNGQYVYYDFFYHDLSTNKNNLIGSWIGREGQGVQAWTTYWFSSRSNLQVGYRHASLACDFIPRGETINDGFAKANWWVHNDFDISVFVQYEKWLAPVLAPGPQTNWTSSVEISFQPHGWRVPFRTGRDQTNLGSAGVAEDATR